MTCMHAVQENGVLPKTENNVFSYLICRYENSFLIRCNTGSKQCIKMSLISYNS